MKRRSFSTRQRVAMFQAARGLCCLCQTQIAAGQAWELHHVIELALGGADDETNLRPAHARCHRLHTSEHSVPVVSKTVRTHAKHIGARAPSRTPFKGWRKFDGTAVRNPKAQQRTPHD